jgi:hypothetical protein
VTFDLYPDDRSATTSAAGQSNTITTTARHLAGASHAAAKPSPRLHAMAEKGREADQQHIPNVARRTSFRRTLRESEGVLPPQYLELLEQKRKQLDESIHKYIAAKEREYKQYEKDIRAQAKANGGSPALAPVHDGDSNGSSSAPKRRTSSESTQDTSVGSPLMRVQGVSAVDMLLASSARRDISQAIDEEAGDEKTALAGLTDRMVSDEREKEFVGLFTPPYLPAIDSRDGRVGERSKSAPSALGNAQTNGAADTTPSSLPRGESDSAVLAKAKRPAHLQLSQRTSSSGSSADGRLASAMKSPTPSNKKPQRKRVSLAIGDNIVVTPSEDVPLDMHISSTSSHSRSRSPANDRDVGAKSHLLARDFAKQRNLPMSPPLGASLVNGVKPTSSIDRKVSPPSVPRVPQGPTSAPTSTPTSSASPKTQAKIDPDGDLFDLEADDSDLPSNQRDAEDVPESEDEVMPGIAGRIAQGARSAPKETVVSPRQNYDYDDEAGLIPEAGPATGVVEQEDTDHAVHLEFGPGSANAHQQPGQPGFRRPSASRDPIFRGTDYGSVEAESVNDEIYGSSYSRPGKGSFGGGSLGESYMARHAEEMSRLREAKSREQDVRS